MKISGHKRTKEFYKYIRISPEEAANKIKELVPAAKLQHPDKQLNVIGQLVTGQLQQICLIGPLSVDDGPIANEAYLAVFDGQIVHNR